MVLTRLLDRLDAWKTNFGQGAARELEELLSAAATWQPCTAAEAVRFHETLLFLRAYPRTARVARLADRILFHFDARIARLQSAGAEMDPFEAPEVSGIAGTSLGAVFSYEFAASLAARHGSQVDIGWDRYDEIDKLGPVLARLLPLVGEDWPVEAHVPFQEWIAAARPARATDLGWLLERIAALPVSAGERSRIYASMELPLAWDVGNSAVSRSRLRLPGGKLFVHREPLIRRSEVSLHREIEGPPVVVRRLSRADARRMLELIVDTSAMRFRELHGFSHPDLDAVDHADLGRGVEIVFFGVPPAWRLPFRAYHGGMFFKNGVPAGYVELLSLFERAEIGFNLYYTFREGESAWLYARLLGLFHQVLGVKCFSVDPYQIGLENPEAIDSGAFWFYRKLGFRPVEPEAAALVAREERRMGSDPAYRSSKRTLERLARTYLIFEGPGAEAGAWDRFRVRNLAMSVQRAGTRGSALTRMLKDRAQWAGEESCYLNEMQRDTRLRATVIKAGQAPL